MRVVLYMTGEFEVWGAHSGQRKDAPEPGTSDSQAHACAPQHAPAHPPCGDGRSTLHPIGYQTPASPPFASQGAAGRGRRGGLALVDRRGWDRRDAGAARDSRRRRQSLLPRRSSRRRYQRRVRSPSRRRFPRRLRGGCYRPFRRTRSGGTSEEQDERERRAKEVCGGHCFFVARGGTTRDAKRVTWVRIFDERGRPLSAPCAQDRSPSIARASSSSVGCVYRVTIRSVECCENLWGPRGSRVSR